MSTNPAALAIRSKLIGALLRKARLQSGKTIQECAEVIGILPEILEKYEQGQDTPSLPELEGLCFFLGFPLERFWQTESPSNQDDQKKIPPIPDLLRLRHKMIGALLRKARMEAGLSLEALSNFANLETSLLESYEFGKVPIPLGHLELLSGKLNRSIKEFQDQDGPVGTWLNQQSALAGFMALPPEFQTFLTKPVNRPYVELAMRLSGMEVSQLRAVAEGLLEITY